MRNLLQRLAPAKNLGIALSPLLLLLFFALGQSLIRDPFRACAVGLFLPAKEVEIPPAAKPGSAPAGDSILVPISLVDEAFRGYVHERGSSAPEADMPVKEPLSVGQAPGLKDTAPASAAHVGSADQSVGNPPAAAAVKKPEPLRTVPVAQSPVPADLKARHRKFVTDLAVANGFSEAAQEELVRSFEELCSMMSAEDAWKITRIKIKKMAAR